MGGGQSADRLDTTRLNDYVDCTFFTRKEIIHAYQRFLKLRAPGNKTEKLSLDELALMPELRVNPFRERICKVFSEDQTGSMSFEDFLDCMSVFSETATRDVKASYAFRLYGPSVRPSVRVCVCACACMCVCE